MTNQFLKFAENYNEIFIRLAATTSGHEIPLFRAMNTALREAGDQTYIEEYHGNAHQVEFQLNYNGATTNPRCELSDLMIIVYSSRPRQARLTYLQAKYERAKLSGVCGRKFSANFNQWYLLSHRPYIYGIKNFKPPSDLLRDALLSSVGSFGFFYKDNNGDFQTCFCSADRIFPTRKGRFKLSCFIQNFSCKSSMLESLCECCFANNIQEWCNQSIELNQVDGYKECVVACTNISFAYNLYNLKIGTPIHNANQSIKNWLAATLRAQVRIADQIGNSSKLARELVDILTPSNDDISTGFFGAKKLIIIKSDNQE